jgi:hypothetical protein
LEEQGNRRDATLKADAAHPFLAPRRHAQRARPLPEIYSKDGSPKPIGKWQLWVDSGRPLRVDSRRSVTGDE